MAAEPSDGLGGPPGTRWRNLTDDTWYQWVSSLWKPCAVLPRRHGRLFPRLPKRPHPHCKCEFLEVRPGPRPRSSSAPPAAWRRRCRSAARSRSSARSTGWSGRRAWCSWDDLFNECGDPRDFDQVVKRKGLTVAQLIKAGIAEGVARRAVGLGPPGNEGRWSVGRNGAEDPDKSRWYQSHRGTPFTLGLRPSARSGFCSDDCGTPTHHPPPGRCNSDRGTQNRRPVGSLTRTGTWKTYSHRWLSKEATARTNFSICS